MRLAPFTEPEHADSYSRDPAATWRRLLDSGQRVSYDPDLHLWLIAGHDNVRTVLSDTTRFANATTLAPIMPVSPPAMAVLADLDAPAVAVTADPPYHLRTRAILRAFFSTTAVRAEQQWGALVARRVNELAAGLAETADVDLIHFAVRMPLHVILDILGLPTDNSDDLRAWTDDFARLTWGNPDPDAQLAYARSCVALWQYCSQAVTDRAAGRDYGSGLIGDLLRYRNGDDSRLTTSEIAGLVLNLVGAGWETSAGALGLALEHALAQPDRWQRLAQDEHYLSAHVEESLRHSPAIDGWLRQANTDVTLDGVTIPAGSRCLVLIGTANHDPLVYAEPQVFDPRRARAGQHLAFGAGPHYCIGAALARLELTTALRTLARRLPHLTLADDYEPYFKPSAALRQHLSLPAITGTAAGCPVDHGAHPKDQP